MYILSVLLLTVLLPAGSALADQQLHGGGLIWFAGKWLVFWAGGVRLFLAGMRQVIQPRYTAETIFRVQSADGIVRELGFANLAMGTLGLLSLPYPGLLLAAALSSGLYYAMAGIHHALHDRRSAERSAAMVTDVLVALGELGFVGIAVAVWS
jgi:hypothetical protein